VVGRQNADIVDTLYLRDVAMATTFWLSMDYIFGLRLYDSYSETLFDSRGGYSGSSYQMKSADRRFRGSKGRCYGNHFGFL